MRGYHHHNCHNFVLISGYLLLLLILLIVSSSSPAGASSRGIPTSTSSFYNMEIPQKRQSDQRIAELETLLALQRRYGGGVNPNRKSSGFGIIDFNYVGRRKKSAAAGGDNYGKVDHHPYVIQ